MVYENIQNKLNWLNMLPQSCAEALRAAQNFKFRRSRDVRALETRSWLSL